MRLRPLARRGRNFLLRYPDRRRAFRELAQVSRAPTTFNEKVLWRMAYDRRPQLTMNADRVAVRDFVEERLGGGHLPEAYGVFERGRDIEWERFPREFAVKATHGCGSHALVWAGAARGAFPHPRQRARWSDPALVHPDDLVRPAMSRLCDGWLRLRYEYGQGRLPEWGYREVPPRILVEELLTTADGRLPDDDYSFFMFDGQCGLIQANYTRHTDHRRDLLDADWNLLPVGRAFAPPDVHPPRPDTLDEMLAAAEALSHDTDFVRVDLYSLDGRVLFSEMTNYPDAGTAAFDPEEFNAVLGAMWTLPQPGQ